MPCLLRPMATLAAPPPAMAGIASRATNAPSRGSSSMGPQMVSATRIPAQPISAIILRLAATTQNWHFFEYRITNSAAPRDHDIRRAAVAQQVVGIRIVATE